MRLSVGAKLGLRGIWSIPLSTLELGTTILVSVEPLDNPRGTHAYS